MPKKLLFASGLHRSTYSHVTAVEGGRLILTAGHVAFDENGNVVGKGDIAAQVHQTYANLHAALEAAGAGFADVIKVTTYVTDRAFLAVARDVRMQYMPFEKQPVSTGLVVAGLAHPDLLVEVEMIAFTEVQ